MTTTKDDIRLLLVDDETGLRNVLRLSLRDRGYHVRTAASGTEALAMIESARPQIVLTDIKMPGMDGIALLKSIKRLAPDIEVIMITGHGDMDLAIQSLKFKATDFITKPINETLLEIALQRAWERLTMRSRLHDYTHRLEQMVEEKTRRLIETERMAAVGETVAGLSHAIKNIAASLEGGSFVVEKGIELNNRQYLTEGWEMVRANVARIGRLSLDLLNYAKSARLACQWCDPNEPAADVENLVAPGAEELGIILDVRLAPDPDPVFLDPDAIHCGLLNLVTNAVEACRGMAHGRIALHVHAPAGGGVVYRVRDNGCGMDGSVRRQLFQHFFTTKGDQGTGVGLMTTRQIIEKQGGSIDVRSRKGAGSEFVVRLPGRAGSPGNRSQDTFSVEVAP